MVATVKNTVAGQAPYRAQGCTATIEETYTYLATCRRVVDGVSSPLGGEIVVAGVDAEKP